MAIIWAKNCRATEPFVTDVPPEAFEDHTGWAGVPESRNRDAGLNRRLAGIVFHANDGVQASKDFTIAAGTYLLRMAVGDAGNPQAPQYVQILDTATPVCTVNVPSGTGIAEFADATGTVLTAAAWTAADGGTPVSVTFATTTLRILIGTPSASTGNSTLAHVSLESGATPITVSDSLPLGVSEARSVLAGGLLAFGVSDIVAVQALEPRNRLLIEPGDTEPLQLTDTASAGPITGPTIKTVSDSLAIQAVEPVNQLFIEPPDSTPIRVTESTPSIFTGGAFPINVSDTISLRLTDSSSVVAGGVVLKTVSDSLGIGLSDLLAILKLTGVADSLGIRLTDVSSVVTGGPIPIVVSDAMALQLAEDTATRRAFAVLEALGVLLADASTIVVGGGGVTTILPNVARFGEMVSTVNLLKTAATIVASSQATGFEAAHLAEPEFLYEPWYSNSTATTNIVVDLGSAKTMDRVTLLDCNFTSVIIEQHTVDAWVTPDISSNPMTIALDHYHRHYRHIYAPSVPLTRRYTRIVIPAQATTDGLGFFRIGGMYFGVFTPIPLLARQNYEGGAGDGRKMVESEFGWAVSVVDGDPVVQQTWTRQAGKIVQAPGVADQWGAWLDIDRAIADAGGLFMHHIDLWGTGAAWMHRQRNPCRWRDNGVVRAEDAWDLLEAVAG